MKPICKIRACHKPVRVKSKQLCSMHYQRAKRGAPMHNPEQVKYRSPQAALAARSKPRGDCLIWTGSTDGNGYGQLRVEGRLTPAHRYAWELANGPIPAGARVDHKRHCDVRCVNVDHLRLASQAENMANRPGPNRGGQTGVRNVYQLPGGTFHVRVRKDGRIYNYGTYATLGEARATASEARKELFGEFAGRG